MSSETNLEIESPAQHCFLILLQQHETSCFLELPEQNQWWFIPGEEMFTQCLLNCNKMCAVLSEMSCLCFLQPRGRSNFRESRGLSSSTVDLYTGNWAAGGQVADLRADLLTDPKMLLPSARSLSHCDHQQHYQTASSSHTASLTQRPVSSKIQTQRHFQSSEHKHT